ncbi:MAG: DHA2 family efflux MFS transporter permease subunit, partial [Tuberibacillus sp.]
GGLDKFIWVTSAYLVTEMAGMPIFGKLSDMYGRKKFFMFGLSVFLIGSILSGTAHSIIQLSIYRAIQGVGGGALIPIAFTIIFDVFPAEQRGKMSGFFGAVFGLSSIVGPLAGAYITDYIDWRWIFYFNIPLGILTVFLIGVFYHESHVHAKQKIDWWGAILLVVSIVCLMFGLELGGKEYAWDSAVIIGLFAAFVVLFAAFLFVETKAEEPIISFEMFKNRLFATSTLAGLFYSIVFVVAVVFIPIFIQGVQGGSATNSGIILLPMSLASVVASVIGGMLVAKIRFRNVMTVSSLILITGIILLATISTGTTHLTMTLFMIITGFGTGFSFSVLNIAAIQPFDFSRRGSAGSTINFVRELGMTVGLTIYGIIQSHLMTNKLGDVFREMGPMAKSLSGDPRAMLTPETRAHIPAPILDKLTAGLSSSIAETFTWLIIPAVMTIFFVLMMGKSKLVPLDMPAKPKMAVKPLEE